MTTMTLPLVRSGFSIRALLTRFGRMNWPKPPVYLSDHYARDIGFEPGTGPIGKIDLPSSVWQHPRL